MEILETIVAKRENLVKGNINCIPLPFLGSRTAYSGIAPGQLVCVTAETSVGKTSISKYLYIFSVADYMLSLPENINLDYKCIWFGLEESIEEFNISILQYALSKYFQVYLKQDDLLSRIDPLDPQIIRLIEADVVQDFYKLCKSFVHFDEITSNPTGIYKECKKIAQERGVQVTKEVTLPNGKIEERYSHYEPNNPNEIVAVVIDNVNILEPEKTELGTVLDLSGCIDKLVNSYARKQMTKHWNWHVCCVQQQQMAAGDLNHFKAGKLEPEPQKLGDNIKVARSYQVIIGLYSPMKHNISTDSKYQVLSNSVNEGLEDCYRTLNICKNRFGRTGTKEPLFFNPKGFHFEKLPPPESEEIKKYIFLKEKILK